MISCGRALGVVRCGDDLSTPVAQPRRVKGELALTISGRAVCPLTAPMGDDAVQRRKTISATQPRPPIRL